MFKKEELAEVLNNYFEKTETEKEIFEFSCVLLNYATEICQAYAEEEEEEAENDTDIG